MNLIPLKASRKALAKGDVFVMKLPPERYLFGRVLIVAAQLPAAPMPNANLVYIYKWQSSRSSPDYSKLTPDSLLIAPVWTNRLGWSKGYFHTVGNQPLLPQDMLTRHCFREFLSGRFLDEHGSSLSSESEPCGEWGLVSYQGIDRKISDALGIFRATKA